MEYEIDDDPQGDIDLADGDRTGGVREDHMLRPALRPRAKPVHDPQPS